MTTAFTSRPPRCARPSRPARHLAPEESLAELSRDLVALHLDDFAARHEYDPAGRQGGLEPSERGAEEPLGAITLYGAPDFPARHEGDARIRSAREVKYHQGRAGAFAAPLVDEIELPTAPERRPHRTPSHRRADGRVRSGTEPFPPARTAALENPPPTLRRHPRQEAVAALPTLVAGLERALHETSLRLGGRFSPNEPPRLATLQGTCQGPPRAGPGLTIAPQGNNFYAAVAAPHLLLSTAPCARAAAPGKPLRRRGSIC